MKIKTFALAILYAAIITSITAVNVTAKEGDWPPQNDPRLYEIVDAVSAERIETDI